MNPVSFIYNEGIFRPLFNLLVAITDWLPGHSVGWAIIIVTLLVRLILLPAFLHQAKQMNRNQSKMSSLQKEIKKIQEQHKDDKAKRAEATMQLYKQSGINPASGCLPLLIQLPILIGLYRVFFIGLKPETYHYLYSFVPAPSALQSWFLGVDLSRPSLLLGIIAGVSQYVFMRYFSSPAPASPTGSDEGAKVAQAMQKNMTYVFPVMTIIIALQLPAALPLYWIATTVFGIIQQYIVKRALHLSVNPPAAI